MTPVKTSFTIAIPTYNRADSLATALDSVAGLSVPDGVDCEVLIVDNNSSDRTAAIVEAAAARAPVPLRRVVEKQQGLCFGRNRALAEARAEHLVFLDDDILVAPGWLHGYLRAVHEHQADCVVGPVYPVWPEPLPAHATPIVLDLVGSAYSRKGEQTRVLPGELAHEVPGCNFGVRREAALELGGFDNRLDRVGAGLLAGGDTEFGMRLGKAGKRVVYEPACSIQHLIPAAKLDREYLRRRADGVGLTVSKLREMHGPRLALTARLNEIKRALGLWGRWQKARWLGDPVAAFDWELRTRKHLKAMH